ncbi:hemicentin-2-like [Montipora capricornis]|uniref:hemicentin-2-like n=1 Tax=Montipora capricornis TaxID=246305 RepID=UPI0035F15B3D
MVVSFPSVTDWILPIVLTLTSLKISEAQFWTKTPRDPFIVVDGVNNTNVDLVWGYSEPEDRITFVAITRKRQQVGTNDEITIASRFGAGSDFIIKNRNLLSKYNPRQPATLQLLNVKDGDEYVYSMSVFYRDAQGGGRNSFDSVFVDVKVPPRMITLPARKTRNGIGSNLTLTCEVSGDPLPNITWTREGATTWTREGATTNQLVNATGSVLNLVRIQLNDAGSYRCTADNGYGVVSSLASVNIICSSHCKTTTVLLRLLQGIGWTDALRTRGSLQFEELASNLTAAISSPYSRPENEGKRPYYINIKEFSLRSGIVQAIVDLQFSSGLMDPLQPLHVDIADGELGPFTVDTQLVVNPISPNIIEISANQTVTEGDDVILDCKADGNPTPNVTWTRRSDNVAVTMPMTNIRRQDAGGYRCTADNGVVSPATGDVFIIVHEKLSPNIIEISANQTVTEGDDVILDCKADGNPTPNVTWTRRSDNVAVTMPMTNIRRQDAGGYRCTADNGVVSPATGDVFIIVHEKLSPNIIEISANQTITEGDDVILDCKADGNPTPNVTWTRRSDNVAVTMPMTIIRRQDAGGYRCTADNGVGSPATGDVFIIVHEKLSPNIIEISANQTVTEGDDVILDCKADGNPTPNVTWTRRSDNVAVTMPMTSIRRQDAGGYRCTADNGVGSPTTGDVFITVKLKPASELRRGSINKVLIYALVPVGVLVVTLVSVVITCYIIRQKKRAQELDRISLQTLLGDVVLQSLLKIEPCHLELTRMRPKNVGILALHQV